MEATGPAGPQSGTPAPPPYHRAKPKLGAGRIVAIVLGSLLAIVGLVLMLGGLALVLAHSGREADGFYTTGTERLASARHAITVEDIEFSGEAASAVPRELLGRVRVRAQRADGRRMFVGIGPEREVDAYLRGVGHDQVDELDPPTYIAHPGGRPSGRPAAQRFWTVASEGPGRQAVEWEIEGGRWTVVAMNSEGSRRVTIDADVAAKPDWFQGAGIALLVAGLLLVAGGVVLIVVAARRRA